MKMNQKEISSTWKQERDSDEHKTTKGDWKLTDNTEVYKALDKIDQDVLLDYVWETPGLVDTIKEWLEEDYTPNWSDRD